jgi:hypothetical protein
VAWPAIKVKLNDKLDFDRDMQPSALSDAQAQHYLGDLLLHIFHTDTPAQVEFMSYISTVKDTPPARERVGSTPNRFEVGNPGRRDIHALFDPYPPRSTQSPSTSW